MADLKYVIVNGTAQATDATTKAVFAAFQKALQMAARKYKISTQGYHFEDGVLNEDVFLLASDVVLAMPEKDMNAALKDLKKALVSRGSTPEGTAGMYAQIAETLTDALVGSTKGPLSKMVFYALGAVVGVAAIGYTGYRIVRRRK